MQLRRSFARLVVCAAAAALAAGPVAPAGASPVCTTVPTTACGGRIVPEAAGTTAFLQYSNAALGESLGATLQAIEALAPRYLEVRTAAQWLGDPAAKSFGGRALWVVRITDETVTTPKEKAAISLSVHALEPAGREGGVRFIEDLARMAAAPSTPLGAAGSTRTFAEVTAGVETWIGFTNPDGWAAGDLPGAQFVRANDNGQDLNRDYPTLGWQLKGSRGRSVSEPDTRAWVEVIDKVVGKVTTSTDIHGELTTPNDAFSDLILPAAQWRPRRQEQVDQFTRRMITVVEQKFAKDGVVLGDLAPFVPSNGSTPTKPANVAAAYDIVGYDDSGFMGDWFSQARDSVHTDVENFLSNVVPNNRWVVPVEQAHIAAARGNIEATMVEALLTPSVAPSAGLGRVGYVFDPNRTAEPGRAPTPGVATDEGQVAYDASRLDYFTALAEDLGANVTPIDAATVAGGASLAAYDSIVVDDMELPAGSGVDKATYVAALDRFAKAGGQLLLTDGGLGLLDDLGIVPTASITDTRTNAGHVDFLAPIGDHPYEAGLVGLPSQTYNEVMLGYPPEAQGAIGPFAPNRGVTRAVWQAAGGTTVATIGSGSTISTGLGNLARGAGRITIFGSILPEATQQPRQPNGQPYLVGGQPYSPTHPFGLASWSVTIAGGRVLDNILAYQRAAGPDPVVPEAPFALLLPLSALVLAGAGAFVFGRRRARRP